MILDEELERARQEARSRPFSEASPRVRDVVQAEQPSVWRSSAAEFVEARKSEPAVVPPPAPPRPIIENTRTIELDRFIPRDQIDPRYYNTPYYIAPRDEVGLEAFSVIRDVMAAKGLVGMGRIVLSNRERPILVEPLGKGLRGFTLRYAHEVRSETNYVANIPPITLPKEMAAIAEHLLETKRGDFDPAYLEDRYRTVLVEKLREKQAEVPARSVVADSRRPAMFAAFLHSLPYVFGGALRGRVRSRAGFGRATVLLHKCLEHRVSGCVQPLSEGRGR